MRLDISAEGCGGLLGEAPGGVKNGGRCGTVQNFQSNIENTIYRTRREKPSK
jgi:hypothetical protein